jgi:hypothetical protein
MAKRRRRSTTRRRTTRTSGSAAARKITAQIRKLKAKRKSLHKKHARRRR